MSLISRPTTNRLQASGPSKFIVGLVDSLDQNRCTEIPPLFLLSTFMNKFRYPETNFVTDRIIEQHTLLV